MSYNKIATIVSKLAEKTEQNLLDWETTEKVGVYQVSFPNYSIRISEEPNPEIPFDEDYIVTIINSEGDIVEEVTDVDLKGYIEDSYSLTKNIYDTARRKAMGVEEALDIILDELDK